MPGVLQVQQHDHPELGRDAGQGDEAHAGGHRQVEAEPVEQPDAARQGKGQGGHDQQGLAEAAESQVEQHEDNQQSRRHHPGQPRIGALEEFELTGVGDGHAGVELYPLGDALLQLAHGRCQVAPTYIDIHPTGQTPVLAAQHWWPFGQTNLGDGAQGDLLAGLREDRHTP